MQTESPDGGAKCGWGKLNTGAVAGNWRLSMQSIVNLSRAQVYDTERPPCLQHVRCDVVHHAGLSATKAARTSIGMG